MIISATPFDRTGPSDAVNKPGQSAPIQSAPSDSISTAGAAALSSELERQGEIRPEMLARGREVLLNPNYPYGAAISNIAQKIANSPDLSEDLS